MGRGKHAGTPKERYTVRLSEDVVKALQEIGGSEGITKGFMEVFSSYRNGCGQELNTDSSVVTWMHKSVRKPVDEGLRGKFLALVDLWIGSDFEDMSVIKIYAAIGSSRGNGAAAKKALKQLVSGKFLMLMKDGRFRPNIAMVDGVAQDEFNIKFERYISIVTQDG